MGQLDVITISKFKATCLAVLDYVKLRDKDIDFSDNPEVIS